jgi:C-terminal processing protease CtpA/Prc
MSLTLDLFVQASISSLRALTEQSLSLRQDDSGFVKDECEEVGIGIYLKPSDASCYLMVGGVHPKGPASTVHGNQINIGDLLVAVNGIDVANQDTDSIKDMIRGPIGSQVGPA